MQNSTNKSVAIIGAGASGLIASIRASESKYKITIFEKNNKIGKKILATGNGKCNIINKNPKLSNFHSTNIDFVKSVFNMFNHNKTKNFFEDIGLYLKEGNKQNRLYPASLQASSVVDLLVNKAKQEKVKIVLDSKVTALNKKSNFLITINDDKQYSFDKVIVATGSLAQKKLGGSNCGYEFASFFNHKLINMTPTLVQLVSDFKWLYKISGVKINANANLYVENRLICSANGDLLFTKYGLSGSAILEISREVAISLKKTKNISVVVDLLPDISKIELENIFNNQQINQNNNTSFIVMQGIINKKLIDIILHNANISSQIEFSNLSNKDIGNLIYSLKNFSLNIIDTKGYEFCEVVAGGVSLDEINPQTMESLNQKNLYFCGEVLDVDGDCGGFNLQWAWSSGYLAGTLL
jgi:predicted Rossmann fold flavoprotein